MEAFVGMGECRSRRWSVELSFIALLAACSGKHREFVSESPALLTNERDAAAIPVSIDQDEVGTSAPDHPNPGDTTGNPTASGVDAGCTDEISCECDALMGCARQCEPGIRAIGARLRRAPIVVSAQAALVSVPRVRPGAFRRPANKRAMNRGNGRHPSRVPVPALTQRAVENASPALRAAPRTRKCRRAIPRGNGAQRWLAPMRA